MKNSYKIILSLGIVLIIALGGLGIYTLTAPGGEDSGDNLSTSSPAPEGGLSVNPFKTIAEYDGQLYISKTMANSANIDDAAVLPFEAERLVIDGEYVYYVTAGDEEYAPELRVHNISDKNSAESDKSVCEFVSPYGSPALIGGFIYSAYYGASDDDENIGIYRINAVYDDDEMGYKKIADGEYYIYGYDDEYLYCTTNDGSTGTVLYRMTLSGENLTEVLNYNTRADNIVVDGNYIFFSAYDDISHSYKIYRSPKDGRGNIDAYAFECFSGMFDIIDGRLYYQADASIYSCELSGSNERKVVSLEQDSAGAGDFLKFGEILYFTEAVKDSDETRLYRYDIATVEKKQISK